jgi:hypothetical protein
VTFQAWTDDSGHFAFNDRAGFLEYVQKRKGCEWAVTVKKAKRQGSQQMRYYRGVVIPDIAIACGYSDPDDYESVHEGLAWKFLRIADGPFGEPRRRSTAKDDLTSQEFSDYVTNVITFAETSIPGCKIRRPDEVDDALIAGGEDFT